MTRRRSVRFEILTHSDVMLEEHVAGLRSAVAEALGRGEEQTAIEFGGPLEMKKDNPARWVHMLLVDQISNAAALAIVDCLGAPEKVAKIMPSAGVVAVLSKVGSSGNTGTSPLSLDEGAATELAAGAAGVGKIGRKSTAPNGPKPGAPDHVGINWYNDTQRWRARFKGKIVVGSTLDGTAREVNHPEVHLGYFHTQIDAINAREEFVKSIVADGTSDPDLLASAAIWGNRVKPASPSKRGLSRVNKTKTPNKFRVQFKGNLIYEAPDGGVYQTSVSPQQHIGYFEGEVEAMRARDQFMASVAYAHYLPIRIAEAIEAAEFEWVFRELAEAAGPTDRGDGAPAAEIASDQPEEDDDASMAARHDFVFGGNQAEPIRRTNHDDQSGQENDAAHTDSGMRTPPAVGISNKQSLGQLLPLLSGVGTDRPQIPSTPKRKTGAGVTGAAPETHMIEFGSELQTPPAAATNSKQPRGLLLPRLGGIGTGRPQIQSTPERKRAANVTGTGSETIGSTPPVSRRELPHLVINPPRPSRRSTSQFTVYKLTVRADMPKRSPQGGPPVGGPMGGSTGFRLLDEWELREVEVSACATVPNSDSCIVTVGYVISRSPSESCSPLYAITIKGPLNPVHELVESLRTVEALQSVFDAAGLSAAVVRPSTSTPEWHPMNIQESSAICTPPSPSSSAPPTQLEWRHIDQNAPTKAAGPPPTPSRLSRKRPQPELEAPLPSLNSVMRKRTRAGDATDPGGLSPPSPLFFFQRSK